MYLRGLLLPGKNEEHRAVGLADRAGSRPSTRAIAERALAAVAAAGSSRIVRGRRGVALAAGAFDGSFDVGLAVLVLRSVAVVVAAEQTQVLRVRAAAFAQRVVVVVLEPGARLAASAVLVAPATL
jgi:hypothetical protein